MVELLKQGQYSPMSTEDQVIAIFCGVRGYLDDIDIPKIKGFETGLLELIHSKYPDIAKAIAAEKIISEETEKKLGEVINEFKQMFVGTSL